MRSVQSFLKADSYTGKAVWLGLALLTTLSMYLLFHYNKTLYYQLGIEAQGLERATAILYAISGICLIGLFLYVNAQKHLRGARFRLNKIGLLCWGLFFLVVAGEEESWGQWIFNYEISESIRDISHQDETNLHNLEFIQGTVEPTRVLNVFVLIFGVLLPLVVQLPLIRRTMTYYHIPTIPLHAMPFFLFGFLFFRFISIIDNHWIHSEICEFFYSLGFFVFSLWTCCSSGLHEESARPTRERVEPANDLALASSRADT
jgi:hypothetical protein